MADDELVNDVVELDGFRKDRKGHFRREKKKVHAFLANV